MKFSTLFAIFAMQFAVSLTQFNFTAIPETTPLIFNKLAKAHLTYETYKLVFFADLSPMFQLRNNIHFAIRTIANLSTTINKPSYAATTKQLEHQWELMLKDEDLLNSFRSKRFTVCETCGKLWNILYGVMDAETARKYDDVINGIRNLSLDNRELLRNQSEIFQNTLKFNSKTFENLDLIIRNLSIDANAKSDQIKLIQLELNEQSLVQNTQLMISEYYRIHGQARRALSDSRHGKISELVPKKQLAKELRSIEVRLNADQRLPIDPRHEDAFHVFSYSGTKSTLYRNNIFVEVSIPICEEQHLNLYKVTPIPSCINDICILPSVHSKYFLINAEHSTYIPMDKDELQKGTLMSNKDMLYRSTSTTLLNSDGICEWQVLKNKPASDIQKASLKITKMLKIEKKT